MEKSEVRKHLEDLKHKNMLTKKQISEVINERKEDGFIFLEEARGIKELFDDELLQTLKSIDFDKHHNNSKCVQKALYLEAKNV